MHVLLTRAGMNFGKFCGSTPAVTLTTCNKFKEKHCACREQGSNEVVFY